MRWLFYRKFLIELNFVLSMSCLYVFGAKNGDERDKSTDIRMLYLQIFDRLKELFDAVYRGRKSLHRWTDMLRAVQSK